MIRILFLSAGTNAAYHCIKTLKTKFSSDFYIIGADINEKYLISTCNYLDNFYKVSTSGSADYYDAILKILKSENVTKFFDDTLSDKKAADIAEVEFIHFNDGFHSKEVIGA